MIDEGAEVRDTGALMRRESCDTVGQDPPGSMEAWLKHAAVVFLAVGSATITLSLWLGSEDSSRLATTNQVDISLRWKALALAVATALVAVVVIYSRGDAAQRAERFSLWRALTAPLLLAAFVPPLYVIPAWEKREVGYLCYLLLLALALERLLVPAVEAARGMLPSQIKGQMRAIVRSPWVRFSSVFFVCVLVGGYLARGGTLTNVSHLKMATMSSDLAEFDNLFFNALHGHPFRAPAIEGDLANWSALKVHAEFGLWMLLPFYAVSPGPESLLWIQTALVGLTAVPIFLLGWARLGPWAGAAFACVYLMMPAVQQPNFYDFHFTPLGMFFVAWLLFFTSQVARHPMHRGYVAAMYTAFALALVSREDVSIGLVVLGGFLVLQGKLARVGLTFALVSAAYFSTMKFVIMPQFGEMWFDNIYQDLKAEGAKGFSAVAMTLVTNPAHALRSLFIEPKFLYLLHMVVPVLALWIRRPILWLALLPGFVSTLLVTNRAPMFQASFQYTYLWVPFVVGASILALGSHRARAAALCALLLTATSLDHQLGVLTGGDRILGGFGIKTFEVSEREQRRLAELRELTKLIPQEASVAATEAEGPHVSTRLVMYSLKFTLGKKPDYLLVGQPRVRGEKEHLRSALESGDYGVVATQGPFVLAKRGADASQNRVLWSKVGGRPGGRNRR